MLFKCLSIPLLKHRSTLFLSKYSLTVQIINILFAMRPLPTIGMKNFKSTVFKMSSLGCQYLFVHMGRDALLQASIHKCVGMETIT